MISTALIKHIRSLERRKGRQEHGSFIAEGDKTVRELLESDLKTTMVLALEPWIRENENLTSRQSIQPIRISEKELERISLLKTPNQVLAVVNIPRYDPGPADLNNNLNLALDNIQDPGNLGTIIRTADWFGVRNIFCSKETADIYNPKVIQATMGSFTRVRCHYTDLGEFISSLDDSIPVYGAFPEGEDLYEAKLSLPAMLVIGNESRGIGPVIEPLISKRLSIPGVRNTEGSPESLNAAIATGILLAWLRKS
jgi:RNA methyltransferase, TrmH family